MIPRSRGGKSVWENIVAACATCNRRKGNRLPREIQMHPSNPQRRRPDRVHPGGEPEDPRKPGSSTFPRLPDIDSVEGSGISRPDSLWPASL